MEKKFSRRPLSIALGTALAATLGTAPLVAGAADQTFAARDLQGGYLQLADNGATASAEPAAAAEAPSGEAAAGGEAAKAAEGKCGEGKCGEGKCGADKKAEEKPAEGATAQ